MNELAGALLIMFFVVFISYGDEIKAKYLSDDAAAENIIGDTIKNIESLKRDCEKDLPRNKECVMVYEFTPADKGE